MKTISVAKAIVLISVMFLLGSCGKYEEGPKLSLASKKGRIMGVWMYDKIISDGEELDEKFIDKEFRMTINEGSWEDSDGNVGTWKFGDKKETLIMSNNNADVTYEIIKLKSKEIWLKNTIEIIGVESVQENHWIPG